MGRGISFFNYCLCFLVVSLTKVVLTHADFQINKETVHTITGVGCNPLFIGSFFIAFTPNGTKAYVTNQNSNSVSVIDTATDKVITTLSVGFKPYFIAITPDGTKAYVTNYNSGSVSVIDALEDKVVDVITVGSKPYFIAVMPDGTKTYVVNSFSNSVSVIDTESDEVIGSIKVSDTPTFIVITSDGTRAYVVNSFSNAISVIDTTIDKVIETIAVGNKPYYMAITPDGRKAYVSNAGCNYFTGSDSASLITRGTNSNTVSVIDLTTDMVIRTIPVGSKPYYVAITSDGTKAYVVNSFSNNVSVIDTITDTLITTIPVGNKPYYIAITSDGSRAYVTNSGSYYFMVNGSNCLIDSDSDSDSVSVIDTSLNAVIETVRVDSTPLFVVITPDGDKAYVVNSFSNSVSVIEVPKDSVNCQSSLNSLSLIQAFNRFQRSKPRTKMENERGVN